LNPAYVRKEAGKGQTLWRASWLVGFYDYSSFGALVHDININLRLRGARREKN